MSSKWSILAVVFLCALLSACSSVGASEYNPNKLPPEDMISITMKNVTNISSVDESDCKFLGLFGDKHKASIPYGEHTLWLFYSEIHGNYSRSTSPAAYTFNFQKGKQYQIIEAVNSGKVGFHFREITPLDHAFSMEEEAALPERKKDIAVYGPIYPQDLKYETLGTLEVIAFPSSKTPRPNEKDAVELLMKAAASKDADAVIDVFCAEGQTFTRLGAMMANGVAIKYVK
jgi:hypothetical protein